MVSRQGPRLFLECALFSETLVTQPPPAPRASLGTMLRTRSGKPKAISAAVATSDLQHPTVGSAGLVACGG